MRKFLGFLIFAVFISCGSSSEEILMNPVNGKWSKKTIQKYNINISDHQNSKNIIFVVRNNSEYPYSNIRFIVDFKDLQTKKTEVDTLNYILAKPNGEWLGTGFGDTKETLFLYKVKYKFPKNGQYEINVKQAMRNENLPGIEDLGIKVETAKP
ncbi:gliding motility-associated lipoprotein GldH [Chryseobacterium piscicola]|jgi:gliding motility-associated lipoprotein GldH|uniref:Gliding motility lipoprotein GldH n=1 Tax=Chryseobacterium piscicola TaxID=551459 RepID=A0A1N7JPQ1_9FLAO|nr:gliding motility lipoprotein GldH [Chryseobacterium piscicola]PQA91340.1 gliding motility lipoprotein GldH [Chryseobacterium piscicola]SIS51343.1 gliding motility-associated lipoprotein GldH [Chryseobacterium piscicola]